MSRSNLSVGIFYVIVLLLLTTSNVSEAQLFKGCDNTYTLNPGVSYLQSPYWPQYYPSGTSCRYKFVAPLDYDITVNCNISLDKNPNSCSTEYFYFAADGDQQLRGSEQFCGEGQFTRKSLFNSVAFAYVSNGSWGKFQCSMTVSAQPCDCGWSVNTRIVNGQETGKNEFPSMVALNDLQSNLVNFCSGTIVSHYYIITAAHCTRQQPIAAYIQALAGDHNLDSTTDSQYAVKYNIAKIIEHPSYTSNPVTNDIALLRTSTPMQWSRGVGPICLPPPAYANENFVYSYVDVIGWGTLFLSGPVSPTLQKVTLLVQNNTVCQQTYQGYAPIYSSQLCTYDGTGNSRDSCQYDSGGPVILRRARQWLLGVISFGKVCGEGGYAMGVNTRITSYLQWIYQNTGYSTCTLSSM